MSGFLKDPRHVENPEQLLRDYAHYLLNEADVYRLPVDLDAISQYLNLPVSCRPLPPGKRGCITEDLHIYLNVEDPDKVQRFTLGHEFMEVMFAALNDGAADGWMDDDLFLALNRRKEPLCEAGAADLVMPMDLFREVVCQQSLCLDWAKEVASICDLSLTSVLRRIVDTDLFSVAFVIWSYKHAPRELRSAGSRRQEMLSSYEVDLLPSKKMRVDRGFTPPGHRIFIPPDKSVPLSSSIYQAFEEGVETSAFEEIDLKGIRGQYYIESMPFNVTGERQVMSLIYLDQ